MLNTIKPMRWVVGFVFLCLTTVAFPVWAKDYTFNSELLNLSGDTSKSKSSFFLFKREGQLPGNYLVDIILAGKKVDETKVNFHSVKLPNGKYILKSCLTKEMLSSYGVDVENYPELLPRAKSSQQVGKANQCVNLTAIPQANEDFDFYNMQLVLNVPQVALRKKNDIRIDRWDDGITAFLLNYMANSSETTYGQNSSLYSHYLQLNPSLNIGAWRIRNAINWSHTASTGGKWQRSDTYATRGLYRLKSRITFGESHTPGLFFDSVPFSGVMLSDDAKMLPNDQRDFVPVIRGIARSQARVEVRRNGYLIYSSVVSSGPFELTDVPSTGSGGDLHVTVLESNGETQQFIIPYTAPAIALRKGGLRYNLMVGRYRPANENVAPTPTAQAVFAYGLPCDLTAFVGEQWSPYYKSTTAGVGMMLRDYGALSSSITRANSEYRQQKPVKGAKWEMRYNKILHASNTSFSLVHSQYSPAGFHSLSDVLSSYQRHGDSQRYSHSKGLRNQTSVVVGQQLDKFGGLSINWSQRNYSDAPMSRSIGAQYGFDIGHLHCSLNWTENQEHLISLSASMPLGHKLDTYAGYRMTSSGKSQNHELSMYGRAFDNQLDWDLRQTKHYAQYHTGENSGSLSLNWNSNYGNIGGNYYNTQTIRQFSAHVSGAAVIHPHGLTFGPQINGSAALVEVPGVSGISINQDHLIRTDFFGYSIVPNILPYEENDIVLEPTDLPPDTEVTKNGAKVIPTEGAIVRASFAPQFGARALITIKRTNGETMSFGSMVSLANNPTNVAIVDEDGKSYLTGLPETGQLLVLWGKDASQQCRVDYQLSTAKKNGAGLHMLNGICH